MNRVEIESGQEEVVSDPGIISSKFLWVLFLADIVVTGLLSRLDNPTSAIVVGSVTTLVWLMCLSASRGTLDVTPRTGVHSEEDRSMNMMDNFDSTMPSSMALYKKNK
jgi:hypothetical protein